MAQNSKEQLNKTNLYLRLPEIITSVVALILKDYDNTPFEAIIEFYKSPTYSKLEKWDTGFWKKDPEELYKDFLTTRN